MKIFRISILLVLGLLSIPFSSHAESVLKKGDVVAICGDSITEQKMYSAYIEDYILMSQPVRDVKTIQFGWGGDNARHFSDSWEQVALTFSPTVVTTSYGMNDGGYASFNEKTGSSYRDGMTRVVDNFKQGGVRTVIVGSPGVVDSFYFKNYRDLSVTPSVYNQTLGRLGDIGQDIAKSEGVLFADVHTPLMETMAKAKAALGEKYPVTGNEDGVHPQPNGHLVMAYAYLKAMGFDGSIGTITYDAAGGTAEATEGHRIVSAKPGEVTVESTRYPFCFQGSATSPEGDVSILPFLPFNQDLNRYILVVKNIPSPKARITWGSESKEFTKEELEKGINLAAEFLNNPFTQPFMEVDKVVRAKQELETTYIKYYLPQEKSLLQSVPSVEKPLKSVSTGLAELHDRLLAEEAAAVKPVTHTIRIEEVQ